MWRRPIPGRPPPRPLLIRLRPPPRRWRNRPRPPRHPRRWRALNRTTTPGRPCAVPPHQRLPRALDRHRRLRANLRRCRQPRNRTRPPRPRWDRWWFSRRPRAGRRPSGPGTPQMARRYLSRPTRVRPKVDAPPGARCRAWTPTWPRSIAASAKSPALVGKWHEDQPATRVTLDPGAKSAAWLRLWPWAAPVMNTALAANLPGRVSLSDLRRVREQARATAHGTVGCSRRWRP